MIIDRIENFDWFLSDFDEIKFFHVRYSTIENWSHAFIYVVIRESAESPWLIYQWAKDF